MLHGVVEQRVSSNDHKLTLMLRTVTQWVISGLLKWSERMTSPEKWIDIWEDCPKSPGKTTTGRVRMTGEKMRIASVYYTTPGKN
jgi:hypothetical protein